MFEAFAMSLSSFCVVSNALRLNFFSVYDTKRDKKRKRKKKMLKQCNCQSDDSGSRIEKDIKIEED